VQRQDRKAGERQQRASPTEESTPATELDLEVSGFDLDEAVLPLALVEGKATPAT
jgi:hypothetical protein